jgi:hypothetical protein
LVFVSVSVYLKKEEARTEPYLLRGSGQGSGTDLAVVDGGSGQEAARLLVGAGRVTAIAGDFGFFGARFLAELAAIFLSRGRNTNARNVGTFCSFIGCHSLSFPVSLTVEG